MVCTAIYKIQRRMTEYIAKCGMMGDSKYYQIDRIGRDQKITLKGGGRITLLSKEGHLGFFL
jgi:hypothetical protein